RRPVSSFTDAADLSIEFAVSQGEATRKTRLDEALEPVTTEIARGIWSHIGIEGIPEAERAPGRIEIKFPLHLLWQPGGPLLFFLFLRVRLLHIGWRCRCCFLGPNVRRDDQ